MQSAVNLDNHINVWEHANKQPMAIWENSSKLQDLVVTSRNGSEKNIYSLNYENVVHLYINGQPRGTFSH